MSKYDALKSHLQGVGRTSVTMSFEEIANLVGGLPNSAFRHQAWWANEEVGTHVQAKAWMSVGFYTERVNLSSRTVTFRRY